MKDIKIVIGANYGDEGKGLMTDYFASKVTNGIVVRFNGGAQAGHTVTTPDGKRHIFGHFGAGTLAGLPTYLSEFYVVNPLLFMKEHQVLKDLGIAPETYIDPNCIVSTPYDMMINQIVEEFRGENRHGSCGVGVNETIERSAHLEYKITINELRPLFYDGISPFKYSLLMNNFRQKVKKIQTTYVYNRLKELGVTSVSVKFAKHLASEAILDTYMADLYKMCSRSSLLQIEGILDYNSIIFEGAQGLLLDQDYGVNPYTTPSNTGMKNVVELLEKAGLQDNPIEIIYASRCYLTRHGAGPLSYEVFNKPYDEVLDPTNVPNDFQGTLRFAYFNLKSFKDATSNDLEYAGGFKYTYSVAITCLDQIGNDILKYRNEKEHLRLASIADFVAKVQKETGVKKIYASYGPTRSTVREE